MKNSFKLAEVQQQKKDSAPWVTPQPCMVCQKVVAGAYGNWQQGWTCSLKCEATYEKERVCTALIASNLFEQKMATSPLSSET
jgi:hypothetical protein